MKSLKQLVSLVTMTWHCPISTALLMLFFPCLATMSVCNISLVGVGLYTLYPSILITWSHVRTSAFLYLSLYVEATPPTALNSCMFGWWIRIDANYIRWNASDACYLIVLLDGYKIWCPAGAGWIY